MNSHFGLGTRPRLRRARRAILLTCLLIAAQANSQTTARLPQSDSRVRTVVYSADEIYRLRGFVGYQIDLEFEQGETFTGLGTGDIEGITFAAQDNHLFIKPKAARVQTNLTVLTTRRVYQFDYEVVSTNSSSRSDVVYALRFAYPPPLLVRTGTGDKTADDVLDHLSATPPVNRDYWYCGYAALKPVAAFDDGVHTHLRFDPRVEQPALFVRNDDGSESLLNFNMQEGEVVIHRIARQFIVRRGTLTGCIVNKKFDDDGRALASGTVTTEVERDTHGNSQ